MPLLCSECDCPLPASQGSSPIYGAVLPRLRALAPTPASVLPTVPPGTGPIMLDEVECMGTEPSLANCTSLGWLKSNCRHNQDAGVVCSNGEWAAPSRAPRPQSLGVLWIPGGIRARSSPHSPCQAHIPSKPITHLCTGSQVVAVGQPAGPTIAQQQIPNRSLPSPGPAQKHSVSPDHVTVRHIADTREGRTGQTSLFHRQNFIFATSPSGIHYTAPCVLQHRAACAGVFLDG